jgi:hypothetical protein
MVGNSWIEPVPQNHFKIHCSYISRQKKKKKYREIYIYFHEYSMDAIRMRICLGKKIEFSSETKGGVFMEERNAYSYCLFKKKSEG